MDGSRTSGTALPRIFTDTAQISEKREAGPSHFDRRSRRCSIKHSERPCRHRASWHSRSKPVLCLRKSRGKAVPAVCEPFMTQAVAHRHDRNGRNTENTDCTDTAQISKHRETDPSHSDRRSRCCSIKNSERPCQQRSPSHTRTRPVLCPCKFAVKLFWLPCGADVSGSQRLDTAAHFRDGKSSVATVDSRRSRIVERPASPSRPAAVVTVIRIGRSRGMPQRR